MKKTGKKWMALLMAFSMAALTACGSSEKTVRSVLHEMPSCGNLLFKPERKFLRTAADRRGIKADRRN